MGGKIRPVLAPAPLPSLWPSSPWPSQDKCMPWTNEKHNRYLDCLEASFVRQLHSTKDSKTRCTDHTEMKRDIHQSLVFNLHKSSEEVDVYERRHQVRNAVEDSSTDLQDRPKLHSRDKDMKTIKSNCYKRSSLEDTYPSSLCHHSSDERLVECTDQNFVDDTDGCQKLSPNACSAKKLKTAAPLEDTPNGDQIPFVGLYSSDKSVAVHSSLEREGGKT